MVVGAGGVTFFDFPEPTDTPVNKNLQKAERVPLALAVRQRAPPFLRRVLATAAANGVMPAIVPAALQDPKKKALRAKKKKKNRTAPPTYLVTTGADLELPRAEEFVPMPERAYAPMPRLVVPEPASDDDDDDDSDVQVSAQPRLEDYLDDRDGGTITSESSGNEDEKDSGVSASRRRRDPPEGWPAKWPVIGDPNDGWPTLRSDTHLPVADDEDDDYAGRLDVDARARDLCAARRDSSSINAPKKKVIGRALGRFAHALAMTGGLLSAALADDAARCLSWCLLLAANDAGSSVDAFENIQDDTFRLNALAATRYFARDQRAAARLANAGALRACLRVVTTVVRAGPTPSLAHGIQALENLVRHVRTWRDDDEPVDFGDLVLVSRTAMRRCRLDAEVQEAAMALLLVLSDGASAEEAKLMLSTDRGIVADTRDGLAAHDRARFIQHAGRAILGNLLLAQTPTLDDLVALRQRLDDAANNCSHVSTYDQSKESKSHNPIDWAGNPLDYAAAIMDICDHHVRNGVLTVTKLQQGLATTPYAPFARWLFRDRAHKFKTADADKSGNLDMDELRDAIARFQREGQRR